MKEKLMNGFKRIRKFERYLIFFLYLALFAALIVYSVKYYPTLIENIRKIGIGTLLLVFLIQLLILFICGIRVFYLFKPLNQTKINFSAVSAIFFASSLFKYVPPKGINYYMRVRLLNKIAHIKGKVTSTFGEFASEFYISAISALILVYLILDSSLILKLMVFFFILLITYLMIFPRTINKVLNLFKLRIVKLRKLIFYFNKLVRRKEYFLSLVLTLITAFLHGLCLYLILVSIGISSLSIFELTIVFYSAQFLSILLMAPAGIGVRDISIVSFLVLSGVTMANAVSISIFYRAIIFVSELFIGLVSFAWLRYLKQKGRAGVN